MSTSAERMRRLRQRRAAERSRLRDPAVPRDPAELLLPAVEVTLAALKLGEADQALAQMARLYAVTIDGLEDQVFALRRYGPLLLRALTSLHATPLSRPSPLDELRAARARAGVNNETRGTRK